MDSNKNIANIVLGLMLVFCLISMANGFCRTFDKCEDKASGKQYKHGDKYQAQCLNCTCTERRNRVLTCARADNGPFQSSKLIYTKHYYIDITPEEAKGLKCPVGMKEVGQETSRAQFYITYIEIARTSFCCRLIARPHDYNRLCAPKFYKDECQFKLVLKTNGDIKCPYNKNKKKLEEEHAHAHHSHNHHGNHPSSEHSER